MRQLRRAPRRCLLLAAAAALVLPLAAQSVNPALFSGLRWRLVGPFRSGRVLAVSGVPGHPSRFYIGGVGGGVWRTDNAGRTWRPIFDAESIASIGAIAVAPSDANVIYVGTGEADMRSDISYGNGVYKSSDGGRTWTHLGLTATRHIASIVVDPHHPNLVLVAALGRAYAPNPERGIYRSTDGGRTWTKVLYKNPETGGIALALDPDNPQVIYASLWQAYRPPWNQYPPTQGAGGGLYKSTDEGATWTELSGHGLPAGPWGRVGVAVAFHDNGRRVFALISARQGGLYRSDNAGASWRRLSTDTRIASRSWYFSGVYPSPANPDVVFICDVAMYRSSDGGRNFTAIKGAPGGDDYHILWISPRNSQRMILGSDQGAAVTLDGGLAWSSWYNQPLGQFYHVITDNQWPYWIYGAQQDSGTVGILSRGNDGRISFRDWHSIGGGESGYVAPDPLDPKIIFAGDYGGVVTRYNTITGQVENVTPWPGPDKYRSTWTFPIVFSPTDPHTLYAGMQYLLATTVGAAGTAGHHWQRLSPDLTLYQNLESKPSDPVEAVRYEQGENRGVIYTIAPSPLQNGQIWIGTDDGLIWLTRDGGQHWSNVTPKGLPAWSKISLIEASHFQAGTAYAAVDSHRINDFHPHIYRTTDFGKSWTPIITGIAPRAYVHAVREDPKRANLLYAGTERGIYVSFNDGAAWQPLQLNLPQTSIRDLAIHDDDLVVATHGRAFWVLDDITPLRQIAASNAHASGAATISRTVELFAPETAIRVRANVNQDTPLPRSTPTGENPPAGAILDYYLPAAATGPVTLSILDHQGHTLRSYSSTDAVPLSPPSPPQLAGSWESPPRALPAGAGMHSWVWDLRYPPPKALGRKDNYSIGATPGASFRLPQGPLVLPGSYTVRLTVDGRSFTRPLTVQQDPRVHVPQSALAAQFDLEMKIRADLAASMDGYRSIERLRAQLHALQPKLAGQPEALAALKSLDSAAASAAGGASDLFGSGAAGSGVALINGTLGALTTSLDSADAAPTDSDTAVYDEAHSQLTAQLAQWRQTRAADLARLNPLLQAAGLAPIE
ncbi:MAG: VPS10 domain-containing protein [Terriglobales bacterium]